MPSGTAPEMPPLVSVVIPVFNQGAFLRHAIESVLSQDYAPLEVIVVDDGSTDETPAVIAAFGNRIRAIGQVNRGAANALNCGIRNARGDLICWLSADDAFLPGKVAAQVAVFTKHPEIGVCCTGSFLVDAAGHRFRALPRARWIHPDQFIAIFWRNPINGSTVMMSKAVLNEIGPFNETLRADVDADMWLRVAQRYPILEVPSCLLEYRVHSAALSADTLLMIDSISRVRRAYLENGTLLARLHQWEGNREPEVLARMSAFYALRGFRSLAIELLATSRSVGLAPARQSLAWSFIVLTSWTSLHRYAIGLARAGRRYVGRLSCCSSVRG